MRTARPPANRHPAPRRQHSRFTAVPSRFTAHGCALPLSSPDFPLPRSPSAPLPLAFISVSSPPLHAPLPLSPSKLVGTNQASSPAAVERSKPTVFELREETLQKRPVEPRRPRARPDVPAVLRAGLRVRRRSAPSVLTNASSLWDCAASVLCLVGVRASQKRRSTLSFLPRCDLFRRTRARAVSLPPRYHGTALKSCSTPSNPGPVLSFGAQRDDQHCLTQHLSSRWLRCV